MTDRQLLIHELTMFWLKKYEKSGDMNPESLYLKYAETKTKIEEQITIEEDKTFSSRAPRSL